MTGMIGSFLRVAMICIFLMIWISCDRADSPDEGEMISFRSEGYDSLRAIEYGADEYGMKVYVMAFLKKGPNRNLEPERVSELQRAHLENIRRLARSGKLVLAGPFLEEGELRGVYIFDVDSIDEAERLTESDPAVEAGRLAVELHRWYGSAALMAVNDIHRTLSRDEITE